MPHRQAAMVLRTLLVAAAPQCALVTQPLGDSVIDGCPAFTARFKRTGPDTAEGTIGRGEVVTTRRER